MLAVRSIRTKDADDYVENEQNHTRCEQPNRNKQKAPPNSFLPIARKNIRMQDWNGCKNTDCADREQPKR